MRSTRQTVPLRVMRLVLRLRCRALKTVTVPVLRNPRLPIQQPQMCFLRKLLTPAPVGLPYSPHLHSVTSFLCPPLAPVATDQTVSPYPHLCKTVREACLWNSCIPHERGSLAFYKPLLVETDVQLHHQMTFISMVLSSQLAT